jgi:hypothetical protein
MVGQSQAYSQFHPVLMGLEGYRLFSSVASLARAGTTGYNHTPPTMGYIGAFTPS